ncbi:MAG: hypothetical protein ACYCW6_15445, partial [Candidatus Xenobia bacterium]
MTQLQQQGTGWRLEKREGLQHLYVAAGRRAYVIGAQDGSFPAVGHSHLVGEMGGVWVHPIKIANGFCLGRRRQGAIEWLPPATSYAVTPVL